MYSGKLSCVRVKSSMEKQYYTIWVCVYSLSYPACKGNSPNCTRIVVGGLLALLYCSKLYHKWGDFRNK